MIAGMCSLLPYGTGVHLCNVFNFLLFMFIPFFFFTLVLIN